MTPCPLLDGLYGIALGLDKSHPEQAEHLRAAAKEIIETRANLATAMIVLDESIANTEALLADDPSALQRVAH